MSNNSNEILHDAPAPGTVRVVLIGDVVGKPGVHITTLATKWLKQRLKANYVVVNAENAADGTGILQKEYRRLVEAGVDAITLGDHIYRKREIFPILKSAMNIVKPANFPASAPGKPWCVVSTSEDSSIAVISLMGRVFMRPVDCPFEALERVLIELPESTKIRLVDLHAEATSDKQTIARYFDGKVTAVLGTHTHVTTADEQILPLGTGFQCDVGMTGPYESILGRKIEPVMTTTVTFEPTAFHVATEDVRLAGTWFDADLQTGKCVAIGRIQWKLAMLLEWEQEIVEAMKRL